MDRMNIIHKDLCKAIRLGNEEMFDTMLPDANLNEFTIDGEINDPLFYAVCTFQYSMAMKLLQNGCPVQDRRDKNKITSFILAGGWDQIAVTDQHCKGRSVLMVAICRHQRDLSLKLIEMGCNVNHEDEDNCNVLMYAVQFGMKEVVLALLKKGCRLNQRDSAGYNALMAAQVFGETEIFKILIEWGCELNKRQNGMTVLDRAINGCEQEIAEIIIEAGCNVPNQEEPMVKNILTTLKQNAKMTYEALVSEKYIYEDLPKELMPFLFRNDVIPNFRKRKLHDDFNPAKKQKHS